MLILRDKELIFNKYSFAIIKVVTQTEKNIMYKEASTMGKYISSNYISFIY